MWHSGTEWHYSVAVYAGQSFTICGPGSAVGAFPVVRSCRPLEHAHLDNTGEELEDVEDRVHMEVQHQGTSVGHMTGFRLDLIKGMANSPL